jgi:SAM-dependent methyltransferase
MWTDVVDLRDFYASLLGQVAARVVRAQIRAFWPNVAGMAVLGLGYAPPHLRPFVDEATRTIAAMPAEQGALHWPRAGSGRAALVDETDLPFADNTIDRVLLVHALENGESLRPMLREAWRVLADSGRLIAVVPSRQGIWARLERTPFGHGRPFTSGQLSRLMRDNLFTPIRETGALYVPPARSRMILGAAAAWEKVGARWFSGLAGVIIMEASKQIYAATPVVPLRSRGRVYAPASAGTQGGGD